MLPDNECHAAWLQFFFFFYFLSTGFPVVFHCNLVVFTCQRISVLFDNQVPLFISYRIDLTLKCGAAI